MRIQTSLSSFMVAMLALLCLSVPVAAEWQEEEEHRGERHRDFSRAFVWKSMGRGYLGVQVLGMTSELRIHFGVPDDRGVLVARVDPSGPAEAAGVRVGDILTSVDGDGVGNVRDLSRAIRGNSEGDSVTVELWRDGSVLSVPVTVMERDRPVVDLAGYRFIPDMGEMPEHDVYLGAPGLRLDEEAMSALEESMKELGERFESEEWREKIRRLRELDFGEIQERMREVEKRLEALEEELEREQREP